MQGSMDLDSALAASHVIPPMARHGDLRVEQVGPGLFNLYGNTNPNIPFATVATSILLGYLQAWGADWHDGWFPV